MNAVEIEEAVTALAERAFDREEFPTMPLYNGNTWFLPLVGAYFRSRDWLDRKFN